MKQTIPSIPLTDHLLSAQSGMPVAYVSFGPRREEFTEGGLDIRPPLPGETVHYWCVYVWDEGDYWKWVADCADHGTAELLAHTMSGEKRG